MRCADTQWHVEGLQARREGDQALPTQENSGMAGPVAANPWELAQDRLQKILDDHSYKNWFSQTRFQSYSDGRLSIAVPSQFFADWLRDHYLEAVSACVGAVTPDFREVAFVPTGEGLPPIAVDAPPVHRARPAKEAQKIDGFNPRYVFERFVVGSGNRFAHAAARAVAENPARAYNPLFLYGGTGLGKTHLMQAIGQEIVRRNPNANVSFISSEHFTNQLIESIAKKSTMRFRAKYRKVDVLLIDDIHFISGKEATQEEFFHTFNALFDMHKQIVISSDRQPKEIPGLEERLVSRFEWGLVTDIQPPDLETRIAILQNKAAQESIVAPPEVLKYIATYVTTNIRELEGALVTVMAFASLTGQKITLTLAEEVLRDLIGRNKVKPITIETVQRVVAEQFDVRISDLRGRSRQRQVAYPRQVAMFLCKDLIPSLSLMEVGEAFGGKDHTTVLYACQKISQEVRESVDVSQLIGQLERKIRT
jgi:chromosomal replication initiator protein